MKREWILLSAITVVTAALTLGVVRWLAPSLLGIYVDSYTETESAEQPSFFEGVFRPQDYASEEFILKDARMRVRAKPLLAETDTLGPHDILGFRNRGIPNRADLVFIGDSQTYGVNVALSDNWPSRLTDRLSESTATGYSMAVGGWGAVQYLEMFPHALKLEPHTVVIAFYTGNDSAESFRLAYRDARWFDLRPDSGLTARDFPKPAWPVRESEKWPVTFDDGSTTVMTPKLRFGSNRPHPAVQAGYGIMANVATAIANQAPDGLNLIFTIVPTKELVYRPRIQRDGIEPPAVYTDLVHSESRNLDELAQRLSSLPGARYVDVVAALQDAALRREALYPTGANGHPIAAGYEVVAATLAAEVQALFPVSSRDQ